MLDYFLRLWFIVRAHFKVYKCSFSKNKNLCDFKLSRCLFIRQLNCYNVFDCTAGIWCFVDWFPCKLAVLLSPFWEPTYVIRVDEKAAVCCRQGGNSSWSLLWKCYNQVCVKEYSRISLSKRRKKINFDRLTGTLPLTIVCEYSKPW